MNSLTRLSLLGAFALLSTVGLRAQDQTSSTSKTKFKTAQPAASTPQRVQPREMQFQAKATLQGTDAAYIANHGLPNAAARDSATGPGNYSSLHGIGPGTPYTGNATYGPDIQVHGH